MYYLYFFFETNAAPNKCMIISLHYFGDYKTTKMFQDDTFSH